jgi:3-oxoadipyl-CoA thiolase
MKQAFIIDAIRTPIGRYAGALKSCRPDDLAALLIKKLIEQSNISPQLIEDIILGAANQAGEDNRNVGRMAALLAGLPVECAGATVNRLCGSGLMAVNDACKSIMVGEGDLFIAGGVESMTRAPLVTAKPEEGFARGNPTLFDTTIGWRFINEKLAAIYPPLSMGETAENLAQKYSIDRARQDEFALQSQKRYAQNKDKLAKEIIPVPIASSKGKESTIVTEDEHPRPQTTIEDLSRLKPVFKTNGTVTAGNSAGINDGAAMLLIASEEKTKQLGLKPIASYITSAVAGVDPSYMGIGPVPATKKALTRAGLTLKDIQLIELNEAFAAQSLACIDELGLDQSIVNVNGGAIALGHPLGSSGARMLTTLIHEMRRRQVKYGLATMCIGVGQGVATIVKLTE